MSREQVREYILKYRDESKIATMFGVPTTDMDRDELLATIDFLFNEIDYQRDSHRRTREMEAFFRESRR